jgi:hypothetical protein
MKPPFNDTFQSFAIFAVAIAAAAGLIGWGLSRSTLELIGSVGAAALVVLGLLWLSVLLARRYNGKS